MISKIANNQRCQIRYLQKQEKKKHKSISREHFSVDAIRSFDMRVSYA